MAERKRFLTSLDDFLPDKLPAGEEELQNYLLEHQYVDGLQAPPDEKVLFYNGIPIGSRGNIIAINGKAKSRKSVIASAIMSSAFIDDPAGFLGFTCTLPEHAKVLNFDTEQGLGHWIEGSKRVIRDAGFDNRPAGFMSHHTRECDVDKRIQLFEFALKLYQPDIAVLDGITDVVYDLNSQDEATRIGGKLMQWSVAYNCLIVCVIHITKGTGYMTGALGSYLEKKCQTALKCEKDEKDDSVSFVQCQYARDEGFPLFGITYDKGAGQYIRVDDTVIQQTGPKANNGPKTKSEEFKRQFLDAIFRLHSAYEPEKKLRHGIKEVAVHMGLGRNMNSGDVTAWIDYFTSAGLMICHPETGFQRAEVILAADAAALKLPFDDPRETGNPVDDLENFTDDIPF